MKTYYQTLGVSSTATDRELSKAFQRYAKVLHPDASSEEEEKALQLPEVVSGDYTTDQLWEAVQEAYDALKTPDKRAVYDAKLRLLQRNCKRCKGTGLTQVREGWSVKDVRCVDCEGTGKEPLKDATYRSVQEL